MTHPWFAPASHVDVLSGIQVPALQPRRRNIVYDLKLRESIDLGDIPWECGAVVVRDLSGKVVGILSERDVVRRIGRHGAEAMGMQVRECMTGDPYTCTPEDSVEDLMAMMTRKRIRHLPVTAGGRIIGVVSIGDVAKRKIEEAEQEAAALKEYISS